MSGSVQTILREVIDIRQASEYLGISGDTLYRYASEGFIPAFSWAPDGGSSVVGKRVNEREEWCSNGD